MYLMPVFDTLPQLPLTLTEFCPVDVVVPSYLSLTIRNVPSVLSVDLAIRYIGYLSVPE